METQIQATRTKGLGANKKGEKMPPIFLGFGTVRRWKII